jgi:hypothetical protein
VTVSVLEQLATLPSGAPGTALALEEVGPYLRLHCDSQDEKDRNARHIERDAFYRDGGSKQICDLIDAVFEDREVRRLRKAMVPMARWQNALKRIVRELSTVYAAPAKRTVAGDANQAKYDALLERVQFDLQMQQVNRLLNLHRSLLVGFRVRELPDGTREPVVDIATPGTVRAVLHPNDPTVVVAWLIRTSFRSKRSTWERAPVWSLWSDHEYGYLDEHMVPVAPFVEHGLGVNRWVPITFSPGVPGFWPGEEGEDLISAQKALALISVLLVKETKSTTKQTAFTGDTSNMRRGQPIESERPIEAPEGVNVTTFDWGTDPDSFIRPADHVLERLANNYGMSAALLRHEGTQSAEARELLRMPLRELRREQQPTFRAFEKRFAQVIAAVMQADDEDNSFAVDGWKIDFGEAQTPLTPDQEVSLFLKERGAGLDNTVDFLMRRNPDLDEEGAREAMGRNIEVETERVVLMKELIATSGSPKQQHEDVTGEGDSGDSDSSGDDGEQPVDADEGKAA